MIANPPTSPVSYTGIVGPGLTIPVALVGTQFYFPVATGPLYARQSGGVWCYHVQGTGQKTGKLFSQVEIQNPGKSPLVFQIVASGEDFIDHRLVENLSVSSVINAFAPSQWTAVGSDWNLSVPDLSGTQFRDSQGVFWNALTRTSLTVQNFTTNQLDVLVGNSVSGKLLFRLASPDVSTFPSPVSLSAAGPLFLAYGPNVSAAVTAYEIYRAVQPGFAGQPPS